MKKTVFLLGLTLFSPLLFAHTQCFLVKDLTSQKTLKEEGNCQERVTPASTFKIPLSLMGFDSTILKTATTPEWKYDEKYDAMPACQTAINPSTWMKNSCVWYSQELTAKLGSDKFKYYIDLFNYGNKDVSGDPGKNNGLSRAWLSSSLKISPHEQIEFLSKLVENKLRVSAHALQVTRDILYAEEFPGGWKLYGKTGTAFQKNEDGTFNEKRQLGWYVGWAAKDNDTRVFAYLLKDEKDETSYAGPRAKEQAKELLKTYLP